MIVAGSYPDNLGLEANRFVRFLPWVRRIISITPEFGFAQLGVFRFGVELQSSGVEDLYVVVGDLPPAYFQGELDGPRDALVSFYGLTGEWLRASRDRLDTSGLLPISVRESFAEIRPTVRNIERLKGRLDFIERHLLNKEAGDTYAWAKVAVELELGWEAAFGTDPWPSSVEYRKGLVAVGDLWGANILNGQELTLMAERSDSFLKMQEGGGEIVECRIYRGFDRLAIFLSRVQRSDVRAEDVWTVVGDLAAYGVADDGLMSGTEALRDYLGWLDQWHVTLRASGSLAETKLLSSLTRRPFAKLSDLVPILEERIRIIRDLVLPEYYLLDQEGVPCPFGGTLEEARIEGM